MTTRSFRRTLRSRSRSSKDLPLKVTASASPTSITVGSTISFSAAVTGNNGSALSYNWTFGGGAPPATQAAPRVQVQ